VAPLCEVLTPCRGQRPHHVPRDRIGTWEISGLAVVIACCALHGNHHAVQRGASNCEIDGGKTRRGDSAAGGLRAAPRLGLKILPASRASNRSRMLNARLAQFGGGAANAKVRA